MGVQSGKSNTDTTGESAGNSQYSNSGGQQAAGSNNGYTRIQYLDPNAIASQKGRYNGLLDSSAGNTADSYGKASQFYGGLLSSPGYDQGTKNAISAIGSAAANEKLDEGKAAAERHAAATGNDSGYTAGLSNLYGMGARDTADRANQNQLAFYQEAQRQKELGGAGMERLFGTAQGAQLGLLGGLNNLSTLGSGTESGGSYQNVGSQYGNGSATNQNTSHQAGQTTHTGGEGDIGNAINSLLSGGKNGGGGGGGLGNTVGDLLKKLFGGGGGAPAGMQGAKQNPDGSWTLPNGNPGYGGLPYGQQNPGFTGQGGYFDENGNWVDDYGGPYDPGNNVGGGDQPWDPYGYQGAGDPADWFPPEDGGYDPSLDPYYDPFGGAWD